MTGDIEGEVASTHTSGRMTTRIEVVGRVSGRRRWTVEQKLAILRDAFGPAGSVRSACERHEIGSGLIYTWRRQAMSGELTGIRAPALPVFAEVEIPQAGDEDRQGQPHFGAAVDASGRHRLAPSGAHDGTLSGGIKSRRFARFSSHQTIRSARGSPCRTQPPRSSTRMPGSPSWRQPWRPATRS